MPPSLNHSDFQYVILRNWEESLHPRPERKEFGGIFTKLSDYFRRNEAETIENRTPELKHGTSGCI